MSKNPNAEYSYLFDAVVYQWGQIVIENTNDRNLVSESDYSKWLKFMKQTNDRLTNIAVEGFTEENAEYLNDLWAHMTTTKRVAANKAGVVSEIDNGIDRLEKFHKEIKNKMNQDKFVYHPEMLEIRKAIETIDLNNGFISLLEESTDRSSYEVNSQINMLMRDNERLYSLLDSKCKKFPELAQIINRGVNSLIAYDDLNFILQGLSREMEEEEKRRKSKAEQESWERAVQRAKEAEQREEAHRLELEENIRKEKEAMAKAEEEKKAIEEKLRLEREAREKEEQALIQEAKDREAAAQKAKEVNQSKTASFFTKHLKQVLKKSM